MPIARRLRYTEAISGIFVLHQRLSLDNRCQGNCLVQTQALPLKAFEQIRLICDEKLVEQSL